MTRRLKLMMALAHVKLFFPSPAGGYILTAPGQQHAAQVLVVAHPVALVGVSIGI